MQTQEVALRRPNHDWVEGTFRALAPRLWRAVLLYSGSADIASDAVSEAFAQAMGNRQEIREPNAWIWSTAFKIAAGEMVRRTDHVEPLDVPMPEGVDPAALVDLVRALEHVSDMQRRALILRHYMGYSNVEVAASSGRLPRRSGFSSSAPHASSEPSCPRRCDRDEQAARPAVPHGGPSADAVG